ncbi:NAD(P)-dependent oxidoreductase, partial [Paenibacillus durus]
RRMPKLDRYVRNGQWKDSRDDVQFGLDVHHKTLGIIGLGGIGEKIVQRARFGFDMDIIYHNRSRNPKLEEQYGAVYRTLDELLAEADFVCLMTPLTPATRGMIGEREFKLMKKSAIFINGSRGATVDEEALIEALRSGTIWAAGLDVYVQEPLPDNHPLLSLDNAVLLPHIGSATRETRLKMAWMAARNLVAGLEGKTPPNLIQA